MSDLVKTIQQYLHCLSFKGVIVGDILIVMKKKNPQFNFQTNI